MPLGWVAAGVAVVGAGASIYEGNQAAAAARGAANMQSTAAGQAGQVQMGAATSSANTLATGATTAAGIQSNADLTAADQANAGLTNANAVTAGTLGQVASNLQPTIGSGTQALNTLSTGLQAGGQFNKPFSMTDAQNMDAYKFALNEGKNTINNAAAAGGTQLSSANVENLGKMATGLASTTETQAFNQWLAQNNLTLGALQEQMKTGQISTQQLNAALSSAGISTASADAAMGLNTAAGTTNAANATATGVANAANATAGGIVGAANAQAAGIMGKSNALSTGLINSTNATNAGLTGAVNSLASGVSMYAGAPNTGSAPVTTSNTPSVAFNGGVNNGTAYNPSPVNTGLGPDLTAPPPGP